MMNTEYVYLYWKFLSEGKDPTSIWYESWFEHLHYDWPNIKINGREWCFVSFNHRAIRRLLAIGVGSIKATNKVPWYKRVWRFVWRR